MSLVILLGCEKDLKDAKLVYENDFESGDLTNITGGVIHEFQGEKMLGYYNNDGFLFHMRKLGNHQSVFITFDLYIHDSWDGNAESPGGPDFWIMEIDGPRTDETDPYFFRTTFTNSNCLNCNYQSYPDVYPFSKSPRSGASSIAIPGRCHLESSEYGTALFSVEKSFRHSGDAILIHFYDELLQLNVGDPSCDESWSLDNLRVWTLQYD